MTLPARNVRIVDDNGRALDLDGKTHALTTIEYSHHEIHGGNHYVVTDNKTLASGAQTRLLAIIPAAAKKVHGVFSARSSGEANLCIYEASSFTSATNTISPINRDRNSLNESIITMNSSFTIQNTGDCIYEEHFGAGQNTGGQARSESEFVLKTGAPYVVILESEAASNDTFLKLDWYEHTDKE